MKKLVSTILVAAMMMTLAACGSKAIPNTVFSVDDLPGKTIGVQLGTTGDIYAGDVEGASIERYSKGFEAVQSLLTDKIDAVIIDNKPAQVFVDENEGLKLLETPYAEEEYAIAVKKGNTELLEKINATLKEMKDNGEIDALAEKYN